MLRERLNDTLKEAMRARDQARVGTLRMVLAAIKDRDIAARPKGVTAISDEEVLSLLQSMIKQRRESITLYEQGNRPELAAAEAAEITLIEGFMPSQLDDAAAQAAIASIITELSATSIRDMGKVMAELKNRFAGQMDFTKASAAVKERLAGG